ncbi:MAG: metal-dependent transcriptional regulator, partial [Spirosomataceae bacterium]
KHRLWEAFLVEKLGFGWDEVHDIAEELEHVSSEILVERLDEFLDYPRFDPHGDPIPDAKGKMPESKYLKLSEMENGQTAILMGVLDHSQPFLQYLDRTGLSLGIEIKIIETNEYDHSLVLSIDGIKEIFVSYQVARQLLVLP